MRSQSDCQDIKLKKIDIKDNIYKIENNKRYKVKKALGIGFNQSECKYIYFNFYGNSRFTQ